MRTLIALAALTLPATAADFPATEISNATVRAKFHLPDAVNGSYQGTRFDWSGNLYSLEYKGHQYFGKWYDKHEVKGHDSITGPVEEFGELRFDTAKPGDTFVRIGVGAVRRPDEKPYARFQTYEIVDPGKRELKRGDGWITFLHTLGGSRGYVYEKTVRLTKNGFLLEHKLRNTGTEAIDTWVYNHNFFVIDNEVVGPDMAVKFGFDAAAPAEFKNGGSLENREIHWARELVPPQSVSGEITGFGRTAESYAFEIHNKKTGAGVKIRGDQPLQRVFFWSIRTVACPEPYISLKVAPGSTTSWTVTYELY